MSEQFAGLVPTFVFIGLFVLCVRLRPWRLLSRWVRHRG